MKKIFLLLSLLIVGLYSFAQIDPLRQKLDSVFQNVNKTQIPTGYLKEYGAELMPLHWFNGLLTESNRVASIDALRAKYTDLYTAKIQSALPAMTALATVNNQIKS